MREMIFFTPVEVEEYKTTNSAQVLNAVVSLELEDQEEIAKKIAFYTYTSVSSQSYIFSNETVCFKSTLLVC